MWPVSAIHCPVRRCHHRSGSTALRAVIASRPNSRMPPKTARPPQRGIPNLTIGRDYRISCLQKRLMISLLQPRKFLVVAFLLAMTFCNVALLVRVTPLLRKGYQDFTIFYTSARLFRGGEASGLYNRATQYRRQLTFTHVPIRQGPLPFNHPPFEALLFVPFTMLDYWPAYLLWTALNLILLAAGLFRPHVAVPLVVLVAIRRWRVLAGFLPVALVLGAVSVAIMGWRGPVDYRS